MLSLAIRIDAMIVPGAIRRDHEVAGREPHLVAVHHRIGAVALDHEAQRGGSVAVGGGELARPHHLEAAVEPADAGGKSLAAGILERDHPAAGLLRADQIERLENQRAQARIAPQHRHRCRLRLPWLDCIGHRPERIALRPAELGVIGIELGRLFDIGSTDHVLAHVAPSRGFAIPRQRAASAGDCQEKAAPSIRPAAVVERAPVAAPAFMLPLPRPSPVRSVNPFSVRHPRA